MSHKKVKSKFKPAVKTITSPNSLLTELDSIRAEMEEAQKNVIQTIAGKPQQGLYFANRSELVNYILWKWVVEYRANQEENKPKLVTP